MRNNKLIQIYKNVPIDKNLFCRNFLINHVIFTEEDLWNQLLELIEKGYIFLSDNSIYLIKWKNKLFQYSKSYLVFSSLKSYLKYQINSKLNKKN